MIRKILQDIPLFASLFFPSDDEDDHTNDESRNQKTDDDNSYYGSFSQIGIYKTNTCMYMQMRVHTHTHTCAHTHTHTNTMYAQVHIKGRGTRKWKIQLLVFFCQFMYFITQRYIDR